MSCCCPNSAPDWTYAVTVTPSDTVDNIKNALYLHNAGTAGLATVLFTNGSEADLYLRQGESIRGGQWRRVYSSGLGAGVALVAFY